MIPLHTHLNPRRDPGAQLDMNDSISSTTALVATGRKPPSIHSAAKARVYQWSRRIMITTESLWLKKLRRNKFKAFICVFVPSAFIFLLAFSLAPPRGFSDSNNLMYNMGGMMAPNIMFTAGVIPKRIHSRRDCEFHLTPLLLIFGDAQIADKPVLTWLWMSGFEVRYTPLLAALSYGATSIEIYLWSKGGVLYVSLCIPPPFPIPPLNLKNLGWSQRPRKAGRPRPDPGTSIFLQAAIDVAASKRG